MRLTHLCLLLAIAACAPAAHPTRADLSTTLPPPADPAQIPAFIGSHGKFSKPEGKGPFPAVVMAHGCGGPGGHSAWIKTLNDWGYATYYIDSFTPRGVTVVCRPKEDPNRRQAVTPLDRVPDAFAALAYLRTRTDVMREKIGIIGYSHGAGLAAATARTENASKFDMPPFAAAIAYYGGCNNRKFRLSTDLLILFGESDDWAPVAFCQPMLERQDAATRGRLTLVLYPGAYHDFDSPGKPRESFGHHIEYNEPAAKDSMARVKAFLDQRLKG